MGISPKTETRCHNFSFFENLVFENLDGRKTRNCGSAFQFLVKCPYPIGAPCALRHSLRVGLRYRFSVPARTDCISHCRLVRFRASMIMGKYVGAGGSRREPEGAGRVQTTPSLGSGCWRAHEKIQPLGLTTHVHTEPSPPEWTCASCSFTRCWVGKLRLSWATLRAHLVHANPRMTG